MSQSRQFRPSQRGSFALWDILLIWPQWDIWLKIVLRSQTQLYPVLVWEKTIHLSKERSKSWPDHPLSVLLNGNKAYPQWHCSTQRSSRRWNRRCTASSFMNLSCHPSSACYRCWLIHYLSLVTVSQRIGRRVFLVQSSKLTPDLGRSSSRSNLASRSC